MLKRGSAKAKEGWMMMWIATKCYDHSLITTKNTTKPQNHTYKSYPFRLMLTYDIYRPTRDNHWEDLGLVRRKLFILRNRSPNLIPNPSPSTLTITIGLVLIRRITQIDKRLVRATHTPMLLVPRVAQIDSLPIKIQIRLARCQRTRPNHQS